MNQNKCCAVCKIVGLLVVLGAINWGLIGAFGVDLFAKLAPGVAKIVYIVVGLAGVIKLISFVKPCPCCNSSSEKKG